MSDVVQTTGYLGNAAINDLGNGTIPGNGTFVPMVNLVDLGVPAAELGIVESKRLSLPNATKTKIPTVTDGGTITISWEMGSVQYARMEALRRSRSITYFNFVVPTEGGAGNYAFGNVPVYVTKNEIKPLTVEDIEMVDTTLNVTGWGG